MAVTYEPPADVDPRNDAANLIRTAYEKHFNGSIDEFCDYTRVVLLTRCADANWFAQRARAASDRGVVASPFRRAGHVT